MSAEYSRRPRVPTRQKRPRGSLEEISVHVLDKSRGHNRGPYDEKNTTYVYVNEGYTGSVSSLNRTAPVLAPPTGVVREQYWACSKWPKGQRLMAIALGVLLGAVIGLGISMGLRAAGQDPILGPVFRGTVTQ